MGEVTIIGIDLAKRSFQVHGARADGSVAYRRKLSRGKLLGFLASQPPCTVAMEACASAHYWGREALALGHEVRLVPPIYVKPFVKRSKNDAADAEAITEAAQRPTMHFVAVKSEAQQARAMLFHTRDLLVRQRTQTINALRGHLAEYGVVAPQGRALQRACEPVKPIWIRSHENHTGPRPTSAASKRPDIRKYLTTMPPPGSETTLAHNGASTYELRAARMIWNM